MSSPSAVRSAKPAWPDLGLLGSGVLILAAVLLVYAPALPGEFLWDDDAHVTKAALRSLHGLYRIWFEVGATQQYYPVLHSAFWFEHRLWGDAVLGYHLVTVGLHALAAWLLVCGLRRLSFPLPWVAGLLFAMHPICVESVAWISEQKNTLSAVFYLSSAWAFLEFYGKGRMGWYVLALGLYVLALLTKSVTATLPAALLVLVWWRRGRISWRADIIPLLPWFVVGMASGLFTAWAEVHYIGAEGSDFALTFAQRLVLAGRAVSFYLGKVILPVQLSFIYPRWTIDAGSAGQWAFLAMVVILAAALAYVARKARGPLAGFFFFVGTLFPALGFVNVYPFLFSYVADHFQYLASIGILVPVSWGLAQVVGRWPVSGLARFAALLLVPLLLGLLSWQLCGDYRDSDTLNRATIARNPDAWLARYNLAVSLGGQPGRLGEAIGQYREVLELRPQHVEARNNLASLLLRSPGHWDEAVAEYRSALALRPDSAEAHNNLGVALGREPALLQAAIRQTQAALAIKPAYDAAHNNLGNLLMRVPGRRAQAVAEYRAAIAEAPAQALYHYDLANALAAEPGGLNEAVGEYRAALVLNPGYLEAEGNLAVALTRLPGRQGEALEAFRAALRLNPSVAQLHANYANALAKLPAQRAEAETEYRAALELAPDDADTHLNYGVLLSGVPARLPDAGTQFAAALRLRPRSAEAHFCLAVVLLKTTGDRAEVISHLRESVALRPDFSAARQLLNLLTDKAGATP